MNKKNIELNVAIALAIVLLIVGLIVFMNVEKEKALIVKETQEIKKESVPMPVPLDIPKPVVKPSEEALFSERVLPPDMSQMTEEEAPAVMLKDLPIDSIAKEQEIRKEQTMEGSEGISVQGTARKTQPSPEDLKTIQQKGLIIH